jgi:hypothetical protein
VIANDLPQTIDIEIRSSGFRLLFYKFSQQKEVVWLDINGARRLAIKNHYYLSCNSKIDKITSQFSPEIKIVKVIPDTIFFNYNKKNNKKSSCKS